MEGIGFGGKRPPSMTKVKKSSNKIAPSTSVMAPQLKKQKFSFSEKMADRFQIMKGKKK
jgi:hypothetical protein